MSLGNSSKLSGVNYLPLADEIDRFQKLGYFVTPYPIIDKDLIDQALHGVERLYEGERDWSLPISGGFLDWRPEHGGILRINDYVSLQSDDLRQVCHNVQIAHVAATLLNTTEIRLFHDQLITKMPSPEKTSIVGWHVDQAYWKTCTSQNMITAWIPLVEIKEEMGGIQFFPGSHHRDHYEWMTTFNDKDLQKLEGEIFSDDNQIDFVKPDVPLGCVSFHHGKLIHGSLPNRGDKPRIALTIHLQDRDNKYKSHKTSDGRDTLHVNDLLCRRGSDGNPDYSDPEICPILWSNERT